jgi:enoyl-CoA hydratase/carnithine racemase
LPTRPIKLPKRIPYHIAMEMLFTGRWIEAEEAASLGFVNHVLPAADLMSEARKMAELLASGPPLVYAAIKEVVREAEDDEIPGHHEPHHQEPVRNRRTPLSIGRST